MATPRRSQRAGAVRSIYMRPACPPGDHVGSGGADATPHRVRVRHDASGYSDDSELSELSELSEAASDELNTPPIEDRRVPPPAQERGAKRIKREADDEAQEHLSTQVEWPRVKMEAEVQATAMAMTMAMTSGALSLPRSSADARADEARQGAQAELSSAEGLLEAENAPMAMTAAVCQGDVANASKTTSTAEDRRRQAGKLKSQTARAAKKAIIAFASAEHVEARLRPGAAKRWASECRLRGEASASASASASSSDQNRMILPQPPRSLVQSEYLHGGYRPELDKCQLLYHVVDGYMPSSISDSYPLYIPYRLVDEEEKVLMQSICPLPEERKEREMKKMLMYGKDLLEKAFGAVSRDSTAARLELGIRCPPSSSVLSPSSDLAVPEEEAPEVSSEWEALRCARMALCMWWSVFLKRYAMPFVSQVRLPPGELGLGNARRECETSAHWQGLAPDLDASLSRRLGMEQVLAFSGMATGFMTDISSPLGRTMTVLKGYGTLEEEEGNAATYDLPIVLFNVGADALLEAFGSMFLLRRDTFILLNASFAHRIHRPQWVDAKADRWAIYARQPTNLTYPAIEGAEVGQGSAKMQRCESASGSGSGSGSGTATGTDTGTGNVAGSSTAQAWQSSKSMLDTNATAGPARHSLARPHTMQQQQQQQHSAPHHQHRPTEYEMRMASWESAGAGAKQAWTRSKDGAASYPYQTAQGYAAVSSSSLPHAPSHAPSHSHSHSQSGAQQASRSAGSTSYASASNASASASAFTLLGNLPRDALMGFEQLPLPCGLRVRWSQYVVRDDELGSSAGTGTGAGAGAGAGASVEGDGDARMSKGDEPSETSPSTSPSTSTGAQGTVSVPLRTRTRTRPAHSDAAAAQAEKLIRAYSSLVAACNAAFDPAVKRKGKASREQTLSELTSGTMAELQWKRRSTSTSTQQRQQQQQQSASADADSNAAHILEDERERERQRERERAQQGAQEQSQSQSQSQSSTLVCSALWTFEFFQKLDAAQDSTGTTQTAPTSKGDTPQAVLDDLLLIRRGTFQLSDVYAPAQVQQTATEGAVCAGARSIKPELRLQVSLLLRALQKRAVFQWCALQSLQGLEEGMEGGSSVEQEEKETKLNDEGAARDAKEEVEREEGEEEAEEVSNEVDMHAAHSDSRWSKSNGNGTGLGAKRRHTATPFASSILLLPNAPHRHFFAAPHQPRALVRLRLRIALTPDALVLNVQPTATDLCSAPIQELRSGDEVRLLPLGTRAKLVQVRAAEGIKESVREGMRRALRDSGVCMRSEDLQSWVVCDVSIAHDVSTANKASQQRFIYPARLVLLPSRGWERGCTAPLRSRKHNLCEGLHLPFKPLRDVVKLAQSALRERALTQVQASANANVEHQERTPTGSLESTNTPKEGQEVPGRTAGADATMTPSGDENVGAMNTGAAEQSQDASSSSGSKEAHDADDLCGEEEGHGSNLQGKETAMPVALDGERSGHSKDANVSTLPPHAAAPSPPSFQFADLSTGNASAELPLSASGKNKEEEADMAYGLITEDDFDFFNDGNVAGEGVDVVDASMTDHLATAETRPSERLATVQDEHTREISNLAQISSSGSSTTGVLPDPPSLPGFTPSSFFSANSPTMPSLIGKTPRTPFSPGQETTDHVQVVGETEGFAGAPSGAPLAGAGAHEERLEEQVWSSQQSLPYSPMAAPTTRSLSLADSAAAKGLTRPARGLRDLGSKYDAGKFALPVSRKHARSGSADEETASASAMEGPVGSRRRRDPSGSRAVWLKSVKEWRPPPAATENGPTVRHPLTLSALHKARLGNSRASNVSVDIEDAFSELDTTDMSEADSMESESADEDDATLRLQEQDDEMMEQCLVNGVKVLGLAPERDVLLANCTDELKDASANDACSRAANTSSEAPFMSNFLAPPTPPPDSSSSDTSDDETLPRPADSEAEKERLLFELAKWLAYNPQMRHVIHLRTDAERTRNASPAELRDAFTGMMDLLGSVSSVDCMCARDGLRPNDVTNLEPPRISVGCQGVIVKALPTALRFWQKLNLSPAGGPKHVAAFVLYPGGVEQSRVDDLGRWLKQVGSTFERMGLGTHEADSEHAIAFGTSQVGLAYAIHAVAQDEETWSDTLLSLFTTVKSALVRGRYAVVYLVGQPGWPVPWTILIRLQEELRSLARKTLGVIGAHITIRPLPWSIMSPAATTSWPLNGMLAADLRRFVLAIYDEVRLAADPPRPCPPSHLGPRGLQAIEDAPLVQLPSFTLCAPSIGEDSARRTRFSLQAPTAATNPLERGMVLYVGYDVSGHTFRDYSNEVQGAKGASVLVSMIDERGMDSDITGFRSSGVRADIAGVLKAALAFTRRASAQFRLVICKSAPMTVTESAVWHEEILAHPALDLTVVCVDTLSSLMIGKFADVDVVGRGALAFLSHPQAVVTRRDLPSQVLLDASSSAFSISLAGPLPVAYEDEEAAVEEEEGEECDSCSSLFDEPDAPSCWPLSLASCLIVHVPRECLPSCSLAPVRSREKASYAPSRSDCRDSLHVHGPPHVLWLHLIAASASRDTRAEEGPSHLCTLREHLQDVTRALFNLTVLGKERFGLDNNLPWPIGILLAIRPGFETNHFPR
ncbi:hypothetical protein CBOM_00483 [Ceraceosorus bombacis]|uniref:Mediator of RNA polymerase II transcription subunit 13 n=1 Tax=Ceraceosorus bombacis TaxID=401625 RepID=A0A0P1B969_9BASI|nr:hypothetical protein CBOM_00483 [Ceraceosorus bombacis]